MTAASDAYIVSKTERTVTRKCPFCEITFDDQIGKDINFIVHLGAPTRQHRLKKEWADYITRMNLV